MGKKKKKFKPSKNSRKNQEQDVVRLHPEAMAAFRIIQSHPSVGGQIQTPQPMTDGGFKINFSMTVSLPTRAIRKKCSETGVRLQEPISFIFPYNYPFHAPTILLRKNFNTSLAHINPILTLEDNDYIIPCVFDGPLDELLHQEGDGLSEILNQLSDWLSKAAINNLIDPRQGWEPIRRDESRGWMVYDLSGLRKIPQDKKGASVFLCRFTKDIFSERETYFSWLVDQKKPTQITAWLIKSNFETESTPTGIFGKTITILVWPDADKVSSTYLPDNVHCLGDLFKRCQDYGLYESLNNAIFEFGFAYKESSVNKLGCPIFVILCVRRPLNLIEDISSLELIPYVIDWRPEDTQTVFAEAIVKISKNSKVYPLGHRHTVTPDLLSRISGGKRRLDKGSIVCVGCGSVGSKIAIHLARAGIGPFTLIDKAPFSPHNLARHALTLVPEIPGQSKAVLLARELEILRQKAVPINCDVLNIGLTQSNGKDFSFPKDGHLIIETTGSLAVREFLSSSLPENTISRMLHAALYGRGNLGVIALEGQKRNPTVNDLVLKLWDERIDNLELKSKIGNLSGELERHEVGMGCDSFTMVMPDTRVSLFAAGVAGRAMQFLKNDTVEDGELLIGLLDRYKLGFKWELFKIGKTIVLKVKKNFAWEIRILKSVADIISKSSQGWGKIETGGVLIGRISLQRRCFTITRVLEAPPDSARSRSMFILGIEGLRKNVQEIWRSSGGVLNYIGTWHSHPKGGDPSIIDENCLDELRRHRFGSPAIGLVCTPSGFKIVLDEGKLA